MQLTFYGAARAVTGSCHCLCVNGRKILIDCGLQQGRDERDNQALPFLPGDIDDVILTHAHIDHSGRLPLLAKQGFRGRIHTSRLTARLLSIMLRDSAHIQESDAKWENQKGQRAGRPPVEPLYTLVDAEAALELVDTCEYGQRVELGDGISFRLVDAGHLLGSASVELWAEENGVEKKIVFSGDIGNVQQPIIRDPQLVDSADYVVMESTYGDRNHEVTGGYTEDLAQLLDETFAKGGNVVIPSFAVGRTQELLFFLREIKERGLVKTIPNFTVCVDSPLAAEATRIFSGDLHGYLDEESLELLRSGTHLFQVDNLMLCHTSEESKALNTDPTPKVIISASGMCDAGRIRHHLKHNLWRSECAIVFVGFQAVGTLGRALLEGKSSVKLFGEEVSVRAKIVNFKGLSSHADHDHLVEWVSHIQPRPQHVFVVHGEQSVAEGFAAELTSLGFAAHAPEYQEVYDLVSNTMAAAGIPAPAKPASKYLEGSPAYRRLEAAGELLQEVIRHNKGGTNKDLGKFTDQLLALIQKWDR